VSNFEVLDEILKEGYRSEFIMKRKKKVINRFAKIIPVQVEGSLFAFIYRIFHSNEYLHY
jgi:hypothetical protein